MVLDISTADFFGLVGHDGSEIAFPALPDPMARRGFIFKSASPLA